MLRVDCPDTYECLPRKTVELMRYLVEETDADYLLKTDDDCFLNARRLNSIRHWGRDYFGTRSGESGHSRDYHFGKVSAGAVRDTTPYLGPWAHGTGYCVSRTGCQWLLDHLSPESVQESIYEDKMVGDAFRSAPLVCQLHMGFNAFKLDQFCRYELDAARRVIPRSIELLSDRPATGEYVTFHLGGRGNAVDPIYRVDDPTMATLFEQLEAYFSASHEPAARRDDRVAEFDASASDLTS